MYLSGRRGICFLPRTQDVCYLTNLGDFDMSVTFTSDLWVHIQVVLVHLYTNNRSHLFHWGHSVFWKQSSCCL